MLETFWEEKGTFGEEEDSVEFKGWKIKRGDNFILFFIVNVLKMFLRCIFRLQLLIFK